jgi:hypothetical protein
MADCVLNAERVRKASSRHAYKDERLVAVNGRVVGKSG